MIERERTNRHGRRRERDECICVLKQTFDQSADCCQSYVATAYPSVPVARPRIQFCVFTRRGNQRSRSFVAPVSRAFAAKTSRKIPIRRCTYNIYPLRRSMCKVVCPTWSSLLVFPVSGSAVGVEYRVWPESSEPALSFSPLPRRTVGDDDGRKMVERGGGDPWWRRGRPSRRRGTETSGGRGNTERTRCAFGPLRTCVCFLRKMSALPVAFDD